MRRFEQNVLDCTFTTLSLVSLLAETLQQELNLEDISSRLRQKPSPCLENAESTTESAGESSAENDLRQRKLAAWHDLKIGCYTRAISALYSLTLLHLFTHIQLSLIAREYYLKSCTFPALSMQEYGHEVVIKSSSSLSLDKDEEKDMLMAEREFLGLVYYALHQGARLGMKKVKDAVEKVLWDIPLKQSMSHADLIQQVQEIRVYIEQDDLWWLDWVLPKTEEDMADALTHAGLSSTFTTQDHSCMRPKLREWVDETRDFMESDDFGQVVQTCLSTAFDQMLVDLKYPTFQETTPMTRMVDEERGGVGWSERRVPFAVLFPVLTRHSMRILHQQPNPYLEALNHGPELRAFAAIVYSSYNVDPIQT